MDNQGGTGRAVDRRRDEASPPRVDRAVPVGWLRLKGGFITAQSVAPRYTVDDMFVGPVRD